MALAVKEKGRKPVFYAISFGERLRALPPRSRRFLLAVGLFGAGDFAHSMLILLATEKLTSSMSIARPPRASPPACMCCTICSIAASPSWPAGWQIRFDKGWLLAIGVLPGGGDLALIVMFVPMNVYGHSRWCLRSRVSFVAMEETLEDSFFVPRSSPRNITEWLLARWQR